MTTSKKLVPLTQPIHITVDNAADFPSGGGGGSEANLIEVFPKFLEDYGESLEYASIAKRDSSNTPLGFHANGSLGGGQVSFVLPPDSIWEFHVKIRDSSVISNQILVFTLYDDADEIIDSANYPIQWMDFGDGGYRADVVNIQVSEVSGIEDALYVNITLVPGSE